MNYKLQIVNNNKNNNILYLFKVSLKIFYLIKM